MASRGYKICAQCKCMVLIYGEPRKGDKICPHRFRPRELITPTVYYENKQGEIWSGPDATTPCPLKGYNRVEVQAHDVRKFERLLTRRMQTEHREQIERQREASEVHARMREQARKEMDAEVLKESESWTPEQREFLDYAMAHRHEPIYSENFDPECRIPIWN